VEAVFHEVKNRSAAAALSRPKGEGDPIKEQKQHDIGVKKIERKGALQSKNYKLNNSFIKNSICVICEICGFYVSAKRTQSTLSVVERVVLSLSKDRFQKQSHLKWLENLNIEPKTRK
jgi:hypothetical protein